MKRIQITTLKLTNFKGARKIEAKFSPTETIISGANGTGKTTMFDAFTWLLFGKDSQDRKTFDIKTLDTEGRAIEKIPHEVEAVLDVDGQAVTLTRRYAEKWTKKRGEAEEQMTGHEETRLWNNVPMSVKDWAAKIDELCSEQVFKHITNPAYFTAQKPEVQRAMLLDMAGNISDAELAQGNVDFEALLAECAGKTMEELKRETAAEKRRVKAEAEGLPARIDELERTAGDFGDRTPEQVTEDLDKVNAEIAQIDVELTNAAEAAKATTKAYEAQLAHIMDLSKQMMEMERAENEKAHAEFAEESKAIAERQAQITKMEGVKAQQGMTLKQAQDDVIKTTAELEALRNEFRAIKAETLTFEGLQTVCPTCGRPLEAEDIERQQQVMADNFNQNKAGRLAVNNSKGKAAKERLTTAETKAEEAETALANTIAELTRLQAEMQALPQPTMPAVDLANNMEYQKLASLKAETEALLTVPIAAPVGTGMDPREAKRDELKAFRDSLIREQAGHAQREATRKRIAELESDTKRLAQVLADLEKREFTMAAFAKARITAVEGSINALFPTVRFKLYEQQINGGEAETCEATVNGVPYSSLNHAGQILAGLEIIAAISRHTGTSAPIFIDNAEAVNRVPKMEAQTVLLKVTEDKSLKIELA